MELEPLTEKEESDLALMIEIGETAIMLELVGLGPWRGHVPALTSCAVKSGAMTAPNKIEGERLELMRKHFTLREANRKNKAAH